jgi:lantibiotic modifying enzyme
MLLTEDFKQQIVLKLKEVENFYLTDTSIKKNRDRFSLQAGESGIILIYSLLFEATKDEKFKKAIDDSLESVIQHVESSNHLSSTFCTGLAGMGWLFMYLTKRNLIDIDIDLFFEDLDLRLEADMDQFLAHNNLDILHGAMGIGLYFLKRNKEKPVQKIINTLQKTSKKIENEILWSKQDELFYDFGLAHGNGSIIYFLTKCYAQNISPDLCRQLIEGCTNFFFGNIQNIDIAGSYFPAFKKAEEYKIKTTHQYSRLAWCYGDIGVLYTLFSSTQLLNDTPNNERIVKMLENIASRRSKPVTGVVDACFCHGSSGVGYLNYKLYRETSNPVFKETAHYWLEQTINFAGEEGPAGYMFNMGELGVLPQTNILNGLGGVGVFLTSILYDQLNSEWDECFFLS